MDLEKNPWKTLVSVEKYENPWIRVIEHKVIHPDQQEGIYGVVEYKKLAVGILPIDEHENTWLVGQYRYPLKKYSWEIPEGGGSLSDPPLVTAKRELQEETGLIALDWDLLMELELSNSVSNEKAVIFLAKDLKQGPNKPDGSELLQIKQIPVSKAIDMVHQGKILDSISVVALLKYQQLKATLD